MAWTPSPFVSGLAVFIATLCLLAATALGGLTSCAAVGASLRSVSNSTVLHNSTALHVLTSTAWATSYFSYSAPDVFGTPAYTVETTTYANAWGRCSDTNVTILGSSNVWTKNYTCDSWQEMCRTPAAFGTTDCKGALCPCPCAGVTGVTEVMSILGTVFALVSLLPLWIFWARRSEFMWKRLAHGLLLCVVGEFMAALFSHLHCTEGGVQVYSWEGPAKVGTLTITADVSQGPGAVGGIGAILLVVVAIVCIAIIPVAPRGEEGQNLQLQGIDVPKP